MTGKEVILQKITGAISRALMVLVLACLAIPAQSYAREITDMFGKNVTVPDRVQKAYATSPPATYMLYALDPGILAGLNTPVRKWEKKYLSKRMRELPVLGGWYGQGYVPNMEMVLKVNPQIIITPSLGSAIDVKTGQTLKDIPIPAVSVVMDRFCAYPDAFVFLGEVLGRQARAEKLSEYARKIITQITETAKTIPAGSRVSVYYAEAEDGLSTECHASMHVELIEVVGGRNVHRCKSSKSNTIYGMEKVSMEQVLLYDPDVILVFERTFFKRIFTDPRWRQLKAVKKRRVYLIPNQPFNWFDRPPSFMRLLGAQWLGNALYPDIYRINIVEETRKFYRLFLGVELSTAEACELTGTL